MWFGERVDFSFGVCLAEEMKKLKEILKEFSSMRTYLVDMMFIFKRVWILLSLRMMLLWCDNRRMAF